MTSNKFVFLCAGMGSRLAPLTESIPKSMVQICGKPLLLHNIDHLLSLGILPSDITLMGGYKHQELPANLSKIINTNYESTNMIETLYLYFSENHSIEEINSIHIVYGDCLFTHSCLRKILEYPVAANSIELPVDLSWKEKWSSRYDNIYDDAETLIYDEKNQLNEIGKRSSLPTDYMAQFMGYIILNGESIQGFSSYLDDLSPEIRSNISSTELLHKISKSLPTYVRPDSFSWFEVDNIIDLQYAERSYR